MCEDIYGDFTVSYTFAQEFRREFNRIKKFDSDEYWKGKDLAELVDCDIEDIEDIIYFDYPDFNINHLNKYEAYQVFKKLSDTDFISFGRIYFLEGDIESKEKFTSLIANIQTIQANSLLNRINESFDSLLKSKEIQNYKIDIILSEGDRGFFNDYVDNLKEKYKIPNSRSINDFISEEAAIYKAKYIVDSKYKILNNKNIDINEIEKIVYGAGLVSRSEMYSAIKEEPEKYFCSDIRILKRNIDKELNKKEQELKDHYTKEIK